MSSPRSSAACSSRSSAAPTTPTGTGGSKRCSAIRSGGCCPPSGPGASIASTYSEALLPWLTFAGALKMALAIFALAWPEDAAFACLILIGLSSIAAVGARFIVPFSEIANVQRAMIWLAGGLRDSRWAKSRRLLDRSIPMT